MINIDLDTNELIKYIALIDNISSVTTTHKTKTKPGFLFRGEAKNYNNIILPKYLRPLKTDSVNAKSQYLNSELEIVSQFRDEAFPFIDNVGKDDYRVWREYAQHYGVPTKLLDWSSNPLVALFFACSNHGDEDGIVWMLNWQNYHAATNHTDINGRQLPSLNLSVEDTINMAAQGEPILNNPVIYRPIYTASRMSAQSSYFMLWGVQEGDLINQIGAEKVKEASFINNKLEDGGVAQIKDSTILYYFIIDRHQKENILLRLSRMGMNDKSLFPGLEGIGKYIDSINKYSEQEYIDCFLGSL